MPLVLMYAYIVSSYCLEVNKLKETIAKGEKKRYSVALNKIQYTNCCGMYLSFDWRLHLCFCGFFGAIPSLL